MPLEQKKKKILEKYVKTRILFSDNFLMYCVVTQELLFKDGKI